jgi:hypothetical protein
MPSSDAANRSAKPVTKSAMLDGEKGGGLLITSIRGKIWRLKYRLCSARGGSPQVRSR